MMLRSPIGSGDETHSIELAGKCLIKNFSEFNQKIKICVKP